MLVIGVTGSIGMGKTTIANMLRDMGVPVHDADISVAKFLRPGGIAVRTVGEMFPEALVHDEIGAAYIDKTALGKIVFNDRVKKKKLEDYLHPLVKTDTDVFIKKMSERGHKIVAMEVPLLFETGRDKDVNLTICVSCSPEKQKQRTLERTGMTSEKFDAIVAGQMLDAEKRQKADYVLLNDGDFEEARQKLLDIYRHIEQTHLKQAK